jgi:hypothetical protein
MGPYVHAQVSCFVFHYFCGDIADERLLAQLLACFLAHISCSECNLMMLVDGDWPMTVTTWVAQVIKSPM